jgi:cell division transport system permease protein
MPYAVREAFAAVRRAPMLIVLSVVAIALCLAVLGLFGLTAHNIHLAIEQVEERVEVVGYLHDGVTEEQVLQARQQLEALPDVLEVAYVSKEQALQFAMRDLAEFRDAYSELEANPLPASLDVRLRPGQRSPERVERVAQQLGAMAFVEDVRFGGEWIERIFMLRRVAAGGAAILGGAFALVAVVVIAASIRIAVFARREEISIMRIVGATDGFIRRPFLLEGFATGLLGGVLALGLTYLAWLGVNRSLIAVEWLPTVWIWAGIVTGAMMGLVASVVAVRRHLRVLQPW